MPTPVVPITGATTSANLQDLASSHVRDVERHDAMWRQQKHVGALLDMEHRHAALFWAQEHARILDTISPRPLFEDTISRMQQETQVFGKLAESLQYPGICNSVLGATGSNNIDIGNKGVVGEAKTIRIGKQGTQTATFVAGISGATVTGTAVVVNGSGQLGVAPSSQRFKDGIKPMDKASEAILALKPVMFRYKHDLDPEGIPQFGLVAEQVEKVNPDLVARDDQGKAYTVRYEAVNAMLLNEFLKEHRKSEEQNRKIEQLEATVAKLQSAFKEQASQIRKVSERLEVNKPAPQMVADNH